MNNIKSHFEIHSRFRNGIFLLSIILFIMLIGYYFYPKSPSSKHDFAELISFQKQIDSLKSIAEQQKKEYRLQPFNPNFISDHKGYKLGLSARELDRLHTYRKDNKWINSITDFKKVTQVSDSLLAVISPLFKFPEWTKKSNAAANRKYPKKKYPVKTFSQKKDLNTVSSEELEQSIGLPDFVADRIIRYRNSVGGFTLDIQLEDVHGLYDYQKDKILSMFTVKTPKKIKKVNINTASVNELVEIPYFDFEMALDIKDFIESNGSISNFDELGKIEGFSLKKIDKIKLYLTIN
ncbi:DNA uptake protein ComE-like DNA-binding protein [Aquimarina sp. MAR_2010_214]|uniref:ComEA family DNA-binding protein n=1 Tax=Aquimarina sp. MAR_2010_214 TaxID=1250026 RepID=UPI000C703FF7|nr:helix-hairpin-helix domain-containing protein [Aquimarina sp. MAR_2010_214]PKV49911.1 DNA uptake protein ComE-like DNA-binding protein [Aquimarina sp. MAR_2010_214]